MNDQLLLQSDRIVLVGPILQKVVPASFHPQIAVDAGVRFASEPVLWVGDGDSGGPAKAPALMKTNQNETDLTFCLRQIHTGKWKELHLFGFLGARKDHELANLGEVCQAIQSRSNSHAVFYEELDPKIHLYPAGKYQLPIQGRFSVLTFEKAKLSVSGDCQYTAQEQNVPAFSGRGVSNEGKGLVHVQSTSSFLLILEKNG